MMKKKASIIIVILVIIAITISIISKNSTQKITTTEPIILESLEK